MKKKYQDYVIKDGEFVGDFEGLYQNFTDPWDQVKQHENDGQKKEKIAALCNDLKSKFGCSKIIDLGCGLGSITDYLSQLEFSTIGLDISKTAISLAQKRYPELIFNQGTLLDFDNFSDFDPDILLLSDTTWFALDNLDKFISKFKSYPKRIYLIHLLTTYPPGIQKYGVEKFTNLNEILKYFNLNYIDHGILKDNYLDSGLTYFSASNQY